MSNSSSIMNASIIEELVTGQLEGERYRQALLAMEAEPEWWRECALAFLEEQALQKELSQLCQQDCNWDSAALFKLDAGNRSADNPANAVEERCTIQHPMPGNLESDAVLRNDQTAAEAICSDFPRSDPSPRRPTLVIPFNARFNATVVSYLSMAAFLLLGFTVGWLVSGTWEPIDWTDPVAQSNVPSGESSRDGQASGDTSNLPLPRGTSTADSGLIRKPDMAEQQSSSVYQSGALASNLDRSATSPPSEPRLTVDQSVKLDPEAMNTPNSLFQLVSEDFLPLDRRIPEELRELERSGRIRIESYDALMPVKLDDGTNALVPVQQFQVKPTFVSF